MKYFNTTGICLPEEHYMCDVTAKFNRCRDLIERGNYFAINFPRQYGKTTMQSLLRKSLLEQDDYLVISTSFEGIGDAPFKSEVTLAPMVLKVFKKGVRFQNPELGQWLSEESKKIHNFDDLSEFITNWVTNSEKKIVLIIDEIDKASNNQVFVSFIAMLRDKYLSKKAGMDATFHSVVLIGVHDVKTLKLKLRPGEETKLNSPWNIAIDLDISFAFTTDEIKPMIDDYATENNVKIDSQAISERLFYYTSGNPFLVSKMCQVIDEKYMPSAKSPWVIDDIDDAFKYLIDGGYTTTNFDDMDKNLENNEDLFKLVYHIIIEGEDYKFSISNPVISTGKTYGILTKNTLGQCDISNKIYEFRILDYMLSKKETAGTTLDLYRDLRFKSNQELNIPMILEKFQLFMKEHHSTNDNPFIEKNGRLLLMSFFRPILNGKGFMFKENVTAEDRKMDLVITYNDKRYVIELKIWYGKKYLTDGIDQLCDYLDSYSLDTGYMLIFNFNKNKKYETKTIQHRNKSITAVFV